MTQDSSACKLDRALPGPSHTYIEGAMSIWGVVLGATLLAACSAWPRPKAPVDQYECALVFIRKAYLGTVDTTGERSGPARFMVYDSLITSAGAGVFFDVIAGEAQPRGVSLNTLGESKWYKTRVRESEIYSRPEAIADSTLPLIRDDESPNVIVYFARRGDSLLLAEVVQIYEETPSRQWSRQTMYGSSMVCLWRIAADGSLQKPLTDWRHK